MLYNSFCSPKKYSLARCTASLPASFSWENLTDIWSIVLQGLKWGDWDGLNCGMVTGAGGSFAGAGDTIGAGGLVMGAGTQAVVGSLMALAGLSGQAGSITAQGVVDRERVAG